MGGRGCHPTDQRHLHLAEGRDSYPEDKALHPAQPTLIEKLVGDIGTQDERRPPEPWDLRLVLAKHDVSDHASQETGREAHQAVRSGRCASKIGQGTEGQPDQQKIADACDVLVTRKM